MIEVHRRPSRGRVTLGAIVIELIFHVVRIIDRGEIVAVTGEAVRCQIDVARAVATRAIQRHMRAGQGELSCVVIEG